MTAHIDEYLARYRAAEARVRSLVCVPQKYDLAICWAPYLSKLPTDDFPAIRRKMWELCFPQTLDEYVEQAISDESDHIGSLDDAIDSLLRSACIALELGDVGLYARVQINREGAA